MLRALHAEAHQPGDGPPTYATLVVVHGLVATLLVWVCLPSGIALLRRASASSPEQPSNSSKPRPNYAAHKRVMPLVAAAFLVNACVGWTQRGASAEGMGTHGKLGWALTALVALQGLSGYARERPARVGGWLSLCLCGSQRATDALERAFRPKTRRNSRAHRVLGWALAVLLVVQWVGGFDHATGMCAYNPNQCKAHFLATVPMMVCALALLHGASGLRAMVAFGCAMMGGGGAYWLAEEYASADGMLKNMHQIVAIMWMLTGSMTFVGAKFARDLRWSYAGVALGFAGHGLWLLVHHQDGPFGALMHKVAGWQAMAMGVLLLARRPYFAGVACAFHAVTLAAAGLGTTAYAERVAKLTPNYYMMICFNVAAFLVLSQAVVRAVATGGLGGGGGAASDDDRDDLDGHDDAAGPAYFATTKSADGQEIELAKSNRKNKRMKKNGGYAELHTDESTPLSSGSDASAEVLVV